MTSNVVLLAPFLRRKQRQQQATNATISFFGDEVSKEEVAYLAWMLDPSNHDTFDFSHIPNDVPVQHSADTFPVHPFGEEDLPNGEPL